MKAENMACVGSKKPLPGRINRRLTVFFSLFVTVALFSGCCPSPETYDIPADFKPYIYFPEGSYWIYRSQDNEFDTLRLVSLDNTISNSNTEKCVSFLNIDADYKSSGMGEFNSRTSWNGNSMILYCCSSMNKSYFNETSNFVKNGAGEPKFSGCNTTCTWEIESSVMVNTVEYKDVFVVRTSDIPDTYLQYPVVCYYAKNVGLIKKELRDGTTWELVRYVLNR